MLLCPILPTRSGIVTPVERRALSPAQSVSASLQEMIDRAAAAHDTWSTTGLQPYDPEHPGLLPGLEGPFKSPHFEKARLPCHVTLSSTSNQIRHCNTR